MSDVLEQGLKKTKKMRFGEEQGLFWSELRKQIGFYMWRQASW